MHKSSRYDSVKGDKVVTEVAADTGLSSEIRHLFLDQTVGLSRVS